MNGGAVYAKIIRAQKRGAGIRLTADEVRAIQVDDAIITSALGGDTDDGPPPWLTPTERRRFLDENTPCYDNIFEPGRRA